MDTILIDNYDSFTWNLYQYISRLGANVIVLRNDQLKLEDLEKYSIKNIVISPGPGSPSTDSGLSKDVIKEYAGKVPILGVCLGMQCIVEVYGGKIVEIGSIVHGKTGKIKHDGLGIFQDLEQNCLMTRYHSLAAEHDSFPSCLQITAVSEDDVIQATRHKEYCLAGVQFHPESVLSSKGINILENFLKFDKPKWSSQQLTLFLDSQLGSSSITKKESILDKILKKRINDVENLKQVFGKTYEELFTLYKLGLSPCALNLYEKLKRDSVDCISILAEIKRASPSKGVINSKINVAQQATKYALGGASVISVLTEPTWFKGSIEDMLFARRAVDNLYNRPLILRKDFIIDKYQILEARLNGADTVLLIVSCLILEKLKELLVFCRSLGMEPLVEVYNSDEMNLALQIGSKVIGINNRNLHNFDVDLSNTLNVIPSNYPDNAIFIALSGINSPSDAHRYAGSPVKGILVGEALMKANDPINFINLLKNENIIDYEQKLDSYSQTCPPLVRICGIKSFEEAKMCLEEDVDLIGLNFVKKSKRYINKETALEIVSKIRALKVKRFEYKNPTASTSDWFNYNACKLLNMNKPIFVALFQDQPIEYVLEICNAIKPDLVQFHGSEDPEYLKHIKIPHIQVTNIEGDNIEDYKKVNLMKTGNHIIPFLDTMVCNSNLNGGAGILFNWEVGQLIKDEYFQLYGINLPIMIAGGLNPSNVASAIKKIHPFIVDVASGVEKDGKKSMELIRDFVLNSKKSI